MQCPRIEDAARLKHSDRLTKYILAIGVDACCQLQSDEFCACVAMHHAGRRIRLKHASAFQIDDDQSVVGGIENASILSFFFFLIEGARSHKINGLSLCFPIRVHLLLRIHEKLWRKTPHLPSWWRLIYPSAS